MDELSGTDPASRVAPPLIMFISFPSSGVRRLAATPVLSPLSAFSSRTWLIGGCVGPLAEFLTLTFSMHIGQPRLTALLAHLQYAFDAVMQTWRTP